MEINTITTNAPLVPVILTTSSVINNPSQLIYNPSQLISINGTVYFYGNANNGKGSELYKLDANDRPVLVGDINTNLNGDSIVGMITNVKGIVYFAATDGVKQGLYRLDPLTGEPVRLGDLIIFTGNTQNGSSANIVNIGDSDYFLANYGDKELWKIDRSSGLLSKVTTNGLPTDFRFDNPSSRDTNKNLLSLGSNLYFRGDGRVWKFDTTTNNASPIQIPNQARYSPGVFYQIGDSLFFTGSNERELYKINTANGEATLVVDPTFLTNNYSIDQINFVNVNGVLHFTTNNGNKIWKLDDTTGKAVLAGTVDVAGQSNLSDFINVNGTLCFALYDGSNSQIWKLKSDGTVASITNIISPNKGNFIKDITSIGNKLYFSASDQEYGAELRELDPITGNLTTFDLSTGFPDGVVPAGSSLNSNIINVNGTPYFALTNSTFEKYLYKLAPAGTVVPTPTPNTPVVTNPTTPVVTNPATPETSTPTTTTTSFTPVAPVEPLITVTAVDKNAAETKTGETANGGQFVLTRKGDVSAAQDAYYLLSGTATNGIDYQKLTGKATFEAGKNTTIVDIKNIVDDNIYEGNETILLSIVPKDQASGGAFKIASNLSNTEILNKLLGDTTGLSNINLTVTGNKEAYGTFDNAPFDIGAGIVLSTGKVTELVGANKDSSTTTSFNTSNTDGGFDPITLKIDFNTDSTANQVFFQYVFGSEEFTDFSGSPFNDLFTLTLNGVNLAKLSDGKTASINNLTPSGDAKTWSADYINKFMRKRKALHLLFQLKII